MRGKHGIVMICFLWKINFNGESKWIQTEPVLPDRFVVREVFVDKVNGDLELFAL